MRYDELDSVVHSVSHDLKAPLVTVRGLTSALVDDYGDGLGERGRHFLARVQMNVQQMERLIQDLLERSRVGREPEAPSAVERDEVVRDCVAEMGPALLARGIDVVCHGGGLLWGARPRIKQVMSNLLGNAAKYMGDQTAPRIEVGAHPQGALVECYVRDNGIGIDPQYHERIFDIFHRLNDVQAEGTGVGLAIVHRIVERTGGHVWVESEPGQGATFHFTWPAALATPVPSSA